MDFTGRALKGMIYVAVDGFSEDEELVAWVERGLSFARSLPSKETVARKKAARKKKAAAKKSTKKKAGKKSANKKPGAKASTRAR